MRSRAGRWGFPALGAVAALCACCGRGPSEPPADLVLLHGKIVTLDPARPEAQALAVRGSRIVTVGGDDEVQRLAGPSTRVIALDGRLAVPGFIEAHAHFLSLGRARSDLDLRDTRSWGDVLERVATAAEGRPAGTWITGRGWHQEKWSPPPPLEVEGYPTLAELDRVAPAHPAYLRHASGHASIANTRALALAGIGASTPDPPGGRIVRDGAGRPTGVLIESADDLVQKALDETSARRTAFDAEAEMRREIQVAARECLSRGITSFQDAGSTLEQADLMRRMAEAGELPLRLYLMLGEDDQVLSGRLGRVRIVGSGGGFLTIRAIKRYMDGALGSRGAWLLEPYADQPSSRGMNVTPIEQLEKTATLALRNDYQLCVHAIGDRAVRETLDLYERALGARAGTRGPRWRVEHAQHVDGADVPRFARLGVIAAMQGIHCASDGPWVRARIGEARAREGAYAWRRLLDAGAVICNGTDAPVEDVDPIASFHALVTRVTRDGTPFFPGQRMTRQEALRSCTASAAYAAFEEEDKGTLAPGKLADITVLSRDILTVPDDEITLARPLLTIVGGKVVHEAGPGDR